MPEHNPFPLFEVFNEIGIIEQLSRARLEARLPDGMIAPHFSVLNHLIRVGDGPTPMQLARAFQVPKTSMTHTLKVLEKRAAIETRSNPNDGRSKQVWLTAKGRDIRDQAIQALAQDFSELAQGIDIEVLKAIQPALTSLRKHLDTNRGQS